MRLSDWFFPPKCVSCGQVISDPDSSRVFCRVCLSRYYEEINSPCSFCGKTYVECCCRPAGFLPDGFVYALPYDREMRACSSLILFSKSRKNGDVIGFTAECCVRKARRLAGIPEDAVLTYVPRLPEKVRKYGIDQAEELAREIGARLSIETVRTVRHRSGSAEQKKLGAADRTGNAEKSYVPVGNLGKLIAGKTVIIVDDIVTTGSTVNACTRILRSAGAEKIICLSAAKRDRHTEPLV
ncbi:MAG: ComF family protein [Clostridia bacterium]|nr:ComF family protein [Clostridia bacterium]